MTRLALIVAALVAASSGARAYADDTSLPERIPQRARELADQGRAYHDAGEYMKAVAAFKEAYVLAPSPGLLFNIAQAYRLAGDCDDAAWMYRRYLDTNPNDQARALAEQHLSSVEKCGHGGLALATIKTVTIAPKAAEQQPATPVDEPAPENRMKRTAVWVGIGGGVALAGAAYFAIDSMDASNKVSDLYKHGGKGSDVAAADARGQRSATLAEVLGIGGGLAVVGAGILYVVGDRHEQLQHVAVTPHANGAQVSLSWQF
ncbi:MAG: tetratricopeptide repeat protein [Deltaproteobacteria bacterium]|nr:tetratricopeptide repeat protein [Deltaproteobacteria bacterium]